MTNVGILVFGDLARGLGFFPGADVVEPEPEPASDGAGRAIATEGCIGIERSS